MFGIGHTWYVRHRFVSYAWVNLHEVLIKYAVCLSVPTITWGFFLVLRVPQKTGRGWVGMTP